MRNILLSLFFLYPVIAGSQPPNFQINVNFKNLPPQSSKVIASILTTPNNSTILLTDTISPTHASIVVNGYIPDETLASITVSRMGFFDIGISPGDTITVNLTANRFWDEFEIFGSPKPVTMANFVYNLNRPQALALLQLKSTIDSLLLNSASEQEISAAHAIYNAAWLKRYRYNIQFADTTQSATALFYALNDYMQETGEYDITRHVENAKKKFGESIPIQSLLLGLRKKPVSTILGKGDVMDLKGIFNADEMQSIERALSKSKLLLIDFWASWCVPCIEEFPYLINAFNKYDRSQFDILSISFDKDKTSWQKAIKKYNLPWTHHAIDTNALESATAKSLNIQAIPRNYLIDKTGKIYAKDLRKEEILKILKQYL